MKMFLCMLIVCSNILMGSILDMICQFRDGLVHRPGCGWGRQEATVWQTGGGSMLDLVMTFRENALREGIATTIVLGRVILSETQVKAWLPWGAGTTDVQLDDFGGGGNGVLTEDGRYEFDMAWLRCEVHYAPEFGTSEALEDFGKQWIDVFPALIGCEKTRIVGESLTMAEIFAWRQEIEAESHCENVDGKQACTVFPFEHLLEKRQRLVARWMNAGNRFEEISDAQMMPGYASRRILGTRPVEILKVYGEYDELPSEYMAQISVEIVRNNKIVCQLIVPQMDAKTVTLTWSRTRDGATLSLEKGLQYSGIKAFPCLSSGEMHVTGKGPFVFGETVIIRFQRRMGGMLLEEVTDFFNACENVSYGVSMGHGECDWVVDDLAGGERCTAWLRSRHDSMRRQVMGLWDRHEEAGLCVSKIVEGVRVFGNDGMAVSYIHGAGELGENRLLENKLDGGWRWVMKAAMNDVSSAFLETLIAGRATESPWKHVVDLTSMGQSVYVEKGAELSLEMDVFGNEEVVICCNDCWAGCNSGMRKLDGTAFAWQMAVAEHDGIEQLANIELPQLERFEDDVTIHVLGMLHALDGDDGWLAQSLTGRLTALALFSNLSELRVVCPRIESFLLENNYFRHGTAVVELKGSIGESWTIQVVDSKGNAIRSYSGDGCNGSILWDGRNEQGTLCGDGCYRFIGSLMNGEFHVSQTISGMMDTQAPSVQIVAWLEKKENGDCVIQAEYLFEEEHIKLLKADLQEIVSNKLLDSRILTDIHGKLSLPIREEGDGVYEWTVYVDDLAGNQGFATSSVKSGVYNSGDVWSMQKPGKEELKADGVQAELIEPLDGAEIDTEIVRVMGTADATGEIQYMLRLWDISGQLLPCMAEEREAGWLLKFYQNTKDDENLAYKIPRRQVAVTEGLLGILDISGLENGRYRLELVVMGGNGTANSLRDIYLEKRIRNGVFEFTETDGAVTIGGMEMKLKRSYSSGELRGGEFGYGWTWSFSATGGEVDDERETMLDVVGNMVSVRCGGSRDVTLTLPDGRRCTYRFSLEEGGGWSFAYYGNWTAPSGVKASLRPTVSNKLMVLPGMSPYWEVTGAECDWELFDFPGFVLKEVDGTEYEYAREPLGEAALVGDDGGFSLMECYGDLKLSCIRKRNGESWQLNERNILHIKANGDSEEVLQMERDEAGRVTKLLQKNGHDTLYEYDDLGNLCRVVKKNGEETLFRQYKYENEAFPHHLTGVVDGRDICLMMIEYDTFGGYCGMRNADGANAMAIRDALDGFELQTDCYGHETLFGFDDKGQMTLKIEADGGRTQFAYDEAGHEIKRTDPLGRSTTQAYDSEGNLTSRKTAGGGVTQYSYNVDGQCTRLVDAAGRVLEAEYDASGHASKIVTPTGSVLKRRFSKDGLLEADLDENGEELALYEHDRNGRTSAVTDYVGGSRQEFSYDGNGKLSQLEQRSFNPETGDVETYGLFYERDDDGNVISMHDSLGEWTQIIRNASGQMAEKRMSNGLHQRYRYDVAERCVEEVDMTRQMVTRIVYDIGGRVVAQSSPEPVIMVGGKVPETIVFSTVLMFSYDVVGRQIGKSQRTDVSIRLVKTAEDCYCCEITKNGIVLSEEQIEHDLAGQVTREVSPLGYETRYLYDSNGNCTAVIDHYGHVRRRELDNLGNVVLQVNGAGHETRMEYDEAGRLYKTHFPDGSEWMTVRDKEGNPIIQTDGEGRTTTMEYAFGNRPFKVILPERNGTTPTYQYGYDSCGGFVSMTDPLGRVRRYERDVLERVSSETSPGGRVKRYQYLGRGGQMTSQTEGDGRHKEWQYDELGRITKQYMWMDSQDVDPDGIVDYVYDDYGRLKSLVSGEEKRTFMYDVDGRVIGKMDGDSVLWEVDYNTEGALVQLVGEMTEIGYTRGPHGRLDGMTVSAASGDVLQEPWRIAYNYDANGQVVQSTTSDGWNKEYVYDACGRCVGLSVRQGEEEVYHVQYTLDRNGRRVSATEMDGDGDRNCFWMYDELGRLVEERIETADGKEIRGWTGSYDMAGNLLEERWRTNGRNSVTRTCQVDDDDCLISSIDVSTNGRSETHYEWNGNGELVKAVTTGNKSETREWSWNADGRLAGVVIVTPSSRVEVTYEYDLEGILKSQHVRRREGVRDETEHREFCFETVSHGGMAMLLEMTEECNGLRTTWSFLHGHELEGWVEDGQICHVWADGSHGIRGMRQDAVITSFATDAWGVEEVPHDGFGYAGEWQDATTGLVYLRGRFYWPEIRRFISVDRHPADMVNPQGWHRYAYCLNDPVNNRDPLGEFVMTATMLMTLKLVAFYTCFRMLANAYYDVQHAEMMENMLKIRKRYYENATIVVHGVTEHEVNWTENFSDTLEKCSGNQDMYEFLWSGFQAGGFVLFFPHHLSHTIASKSLVYCLCELYMKGYANVNVIAHSWGTVLSRDAMNSSGLSFGLWATMGSPLGETFPKFGYRMWQNFYSSEDGVPLLTWLLFLLGYSDNLKPLFMQRINVQQHKTYSGGPIDAHSSYWTDPTVFNDILSVLKWQ